MANDDSGAAFIWLGGSDAAQEGRWAWVNNDEQFWAGDFNGSPVAGRFANWGIQPDNAHGDEDSLAIGLEIGQSLRSGHQRAMERLHASKRCSTSLIRWALRSRYGRGRAC